MFGFTAQRDIPGGPWAGLPTAQQPYAGSSQVWEPAQQAPWRMSPFQTQGMPTATPIAQPPQQQSNPYLSQGTSADIPGFNPMTPGGGMYPIGQQAQAPQQAQPPQAFMGQGGVGSFEYAMGQRDPSAKGWEGPSTPMPIQDMERFAQQNPYSIPGGIHNPIHPQYGSYDPFGMQGNTFGLG